MSALIWSKVTCTFCVKAKQLLKQNNLAYEERVIGEGWTREQLLTEVPNAQTVPQIFIENLYIGGYNELKEYFNSK